MNAPITQVNTQVTSLEAAQSGLPTGNTRKLGSGEKSRIDRFIKAHLNGLAKRTAAEQTKNAASGASQISAEEQAAAFALSGSPRQTSRRTNSRNADLYQVLFKSDDDYMEIDLKDFQGSLLKQRQSLVDMTNWSEPQKALRKFLLVEMTLEDKSIDPELSRLCETLKNKLLDDQGDYIRGSISAVEVGREMKMSPLKLKDFIRAYQTLDLPQSDGKTPDLIQLFKTVKKAIEAGRGTEEMVNMCNGLYMVLKREKSQTPSKATSTRQYLILSRIKQLQTLTLTKSRHSEFLNTCKKANLYALPTLSDLMSTCLQITVGGDTITGVNNLMKLAGAVGSQKPGGGDMFIPHYSRFVLQSDQLQKLFKSTFHQKQVGDHISKSVKVTSVLKEGAAAFS